ncbi:MAG: TSUP family transporter [Flavobacteriaceae bacterium]|nr:MAG: TSUP family transporter [Flavobacteriaceae bacterium]
MIFLQFLEIIESHWLILLLFFIIAILYASVGFGGGSSYLAILALTGIAFTQIRTTALLCNVVVVAGNVLVFQKQKLLDWKKVVPLVVVSVPLAYLGGTVKISQAFFFILLGLTLLFAAITMWVSKRIITNKETSDKKSSVKNGIYGGFIGFISGMVGIGGGIFLAPILHLSNWGTPKKIAATASFFILVNSIAGLIGQYSSENFNSNGYVTFTLLVVVFIGGQIGNRMNIRYFTPIQLRKATAILIIFVAIRILWKSFNLLIY